LDDAVAFYALREILIRSTNDYPFDPFVPGSQRGGRSKRIVCFKFDHRPNDEARRCQDFLE